MDHAQTQVLHQSQILQLQRQIAVLTQRLDRMQPGRRGGGDIDPMFRVFIADTGATDVTFAEQMLADGEWENGDPRKSRFCTDDTDPSAIIDMDGGMCALLEMEDVSDGDKVKRYVRLGGGGAIPVLLSGSPIRQGSFDKWDYFGFVLKPKKDGVDPDLWELAGDGDPVAVVNDMELAADPASIAAGQLDGTHHQTGATNGSITDSCKVLPFRPGALVHCLVSNGLYHFSLPNTIGPE